MGESRRVSCPQTAGNFLSSLERLFLDMDISDVSVCIRLCQGQVVRVEQRYVSTYELAGKRTTRQGIAAPPRPVANGSRSRVIRLPADINDAIRDHIQDYWIEVRSRWMAFAKLRLDVKHHTISSVDYSADFRKNEREFVEAIVRGRLEVGTPV